MVTKKKVGERKEKASVKSSSRAIKIKSAMEEAVSIVAEKRPNKHRSYIKVREVETQGAVQIGASDGKDLFFLGTHDLDVIHNTIQQIRRICSKGTQVSESSAIQINAALASIIEIDPLDSIELMLASQMVSVHYMAMEMSHRAMYFEQTEYGININTNRMIKLMRTYATLVETLSKYRNKGRQLITVKHQHVNVNDGGQAIVGDVNQGGGNG